MIFKQFMDTKKSIIGQIIFFTLTFFNLKLCIFLSLTFPLRSGSMWLIYLFKNGGSDGPCIALHHV
jgi:hypothetical protein